MIARRFFLIAAVFAGLAVTAGPTAAAELEAGAKGFIESLAKEAIDSLADVKKPRQERVVAFRKLFNDRFAVLSIGKWILGRNWRAATSDERKEYLMLFEDLMVATYVDRFANYAGEQLNVVKAVADDETRATVHTDIVRPSSASSKPVSVLWRVGDAGGGVYKILDVVVEGASMSQTLRQEFASIVKQKGSVSGLLEELRAKTKSLKEQAQN